LIETIAITVFIKVITFSSYLHQLPDNI